MKTAKGELRAGTLTILFLLAGASPMFGQAFSFKQDVMGETLEQYRANNPADCPDKNLVPDEKGSDDLTCKVAVPGTYVGKKLAAKRVSFLHGKLYRIVITFPHADYTTIQVALKEKYGKSVDSYTSRSVYIMFAEAMLRREMTREERLNVPEIGTSNKWSNDVSSIDTSEYELADPTFQTSNVAFFHTTLLAESLASGKQRRLAAEAAAKSDM